jgi:hypothetical protein
MIFFPAESMAFFSATISTSEEKSKDGIRASA